MKFLEAKKLPRNTEENKMQGGSRPDQRREPDAATLAQSLGVDLKAVKGTGENGAVLAQDVRNAAKENRQRNQDSPPISGRKEPDKHK